MNEENQTQSDVDLRELAVQRSEPAAHDGRSRRHMLTRYVLPVALIIGFLLVMGWALRNVLLPARPVKIAPVHVSRAGFQQAGTPMFRASGWVEPRPTPYRVAALTEGVVRDLKVVEDQAVEEGDIIATLVDEDAKLAVDRAKAELDQANALLAEAKTRYEFPLHLQAALAQSEATLAASDRELTSLPYAISRAEARLALAERDLKGKRTAGDAVSGLAVQQASREQIDAKATLDEQNVYQSQLKRQRDALERQRDALSKQLELKTEELRAVDQSKARVKLAQVAVDEAQLRLDRMTIRSPIKGRVLHLLSSPGTHLQGGMGRSGEHDGGVVVTLYRPNQLQLRVDVRFEDLPQVVQGQPVLIESPAVTAPMKGTVLFLSSRADIQKNTLEVKVAIDEPPEVMKPEMLVDVTFLAPEQPESESAPSEQMHLFVPKQLVQRGEDGSYVWVADQAAGVARRTPIVTGLRGTSKLIEITNGLAVASKLIAPPYEGLRDGTRIRITGEDENLGVD